MRFVQGGLGISTTEIPFSVSNFNATGGGTWTLVAANQVTYEMTQVGNLLHLDFTSSGGTVAGNPPELLLTLPITVNSESTCFVVIDPLGNPSGGMGIINANSNVLRLRPLAGNWTNGATPLSLEITFAM